MSLQIPGQARNDEQSGGMLNMIHGPYHPGENAAAITA